jgi:hypothetical protein
MAAKSGRGFAEGALTKLPTVVIRPSRVQDGPAPGVAEHWVG